MLAARWIGIQLACLIASLEWNESRQLVFVW
jgi:hypothetical protein